MSQQELQLFIHTQGIKPTVLVAAPDVTLREILVRIDVYRDNQDAFMVFIGECHEALEEADEVEDGSDKHEPVDVSLTVEALELRRHRHVHFHRCRHIEVEVNFGGKSKRRKFSPATTIGVVTQWARKKFHLDPATASDYVLRICNSNVQPRPNTHLGELVEATTCFICFDLVTEVTPQG
jgi:hypothetical protein